MSGGGGGVRPDERAMKQRTRRTGVFLVLQASATSHVIYTGAAGADKLTNCIYACYAQFHSLNELFVA